MLPPREETILKAIVTQYIATATPVPSEDLSKNYGLKVSPATIRNEMARLEQEDYITRPHTSAGGIPTDKGYRYYVETLRNFELPPAEQRLISHLFHQVEMEIEAWLDLAATLIAQFVHGMALVTKPRLPACRFKHLELVSLQDKLALIVLVLHGAKLKQQLITFDQTMSQSQLTTLAIKLDAAYAGFTRIQIQAKTLELSPIGKQISDSLLKMMEVEDRQDYEEPYLDGWHFIFTQPEFTRNRRMLALMELVEQRSLMRTILPPELASRGVQVIIGSENKAEVVRDYSIVLSRYGLLEEAMGTLGVIGLTRMPYARAISTVDYLASVLSKLVAELYGKEIPISEKHP